MKKITLILTALFAAGTIYAQNITKEQQDSLLNLMMDPTYWDRIQLGEVVFKSSQPKTHVQDDAMRTIIIGSALEKAGSATDALDKIPMLEVEKGKAPEVAGRGAAEVYINGRKVQDMNELDRLRSRDIQYVDVVTTPDARYSSSTKAVVRIQLKNFAHHAHHQSRCLQPIPHRPPHYWRMEPQMESLPVVPELPEADN